MNDRQNKALQKMCRGYLKQLRYLANKHGFLPQLNALIGANKRKECEGTEHECEMLARMLNDERITRVDVPVLLNKSYRQSINDDDFEHIKKLPHLGIYSKISTILFMER